MVGTLFLFLFGNKGFIIWYAEWNKTHVPLGKGFSFHICQIYKGKVVIRCLFASYKLHTLFSHSSPKKNTKETTFFNLIHVLSDVASDVNVVKNVISVALFIFPT